MEHRTEAALRTLGLLQKSEAAIDAAYRAVAQLSLALPDLQKDAGLSPVYGHELFGTVAASQTAIVAARSEMVAAHNRLYAIERKLGLSITAAGPLDKPDPEDTIPRVDTNRSNHRHAA